MSVQTIKPMQDANHLGIAFVTALILHGGVFAAITFWSSQEVVTAPGEQEITIDLAPAMEEAISIAPAEVSAVSVPPPEVESQPQETTEVEEQSPEEITELNEPEQIVEARPVDEALAQDPEAAVTLPPQEEAIAQPIEEKSIPQPVKRPPPKPEKRRPQLHPKIAEQKPPAVSREGQLSASSENMSGAAASADPTIKNRYYASVRAALQRRLRDPRRAGQGITGTVRVAFRVDRTGRILSTSLVNSSGNSLLDQAAIEVTRVGTILPSAPASLPDSEFSFSLPLSFTPSR